MRSLNQHQSAAIANVKLQLRDFEDSLTKLRGAKVSILILFQCLKDGSQAMINMCLYAYGVVFRHAYMNIITCHVSKWLAYL